eukprot:3273386-Amphidinium_carterae.1
MAWGLEFIRRSLKGEPMVIEPPTKRRRTADDMQSSPRAYPTAVKIEPAQMAPLQGPTYTEFVSEDEADDVEFLGMLQSAVAGVVKTEIGDGDDGGVTPARYARPLPEFEAELEDEVAKLLNGELSDTV